jgi:pilus assembly protein CpaE
MPAPLSVADLEAVDPWRLRGVVQLCRKHYQYVILDMPHIIDDTSLVGLDEADEIFLVCDMVLTSIRNTIRALEAFKELEYKRDKMRLIINRYYDSHQVSLEEIQRHVDLPIYWLIPYDTETAVKALNSGQTFDGADPDSDLAHSVVALAQHTIGVTPRGLERKKKGLFSWTR